MTNNYAQTRLSSKKPIKRRRTANKRKKTSPLSDKTTLLLIKVLICVFVVIVMLIIKLMLPDTMDTMKDSIKSWVSGDVDYRSAMTVMGEAMMGKKNVFEALPEAYSYAFGIIDETNEAFTVVNTDTPDTTERQEPLIVKNETDEVVEVNETNSDEMLEQPVPETDPVALFLETQSEFENIQLPEKVTYEMPEIGLELGIPALGPVTSSFGYRDHPVSGEIAFHYGTDIGAIKGSDILAAEDGTVLAVGESTGYGKYLIIQHNNGIKTQYAHCSEIIAKEGSAVKKGEAVAKVGDTGNATSACLHFEVMVDGIYVNPEYYLKWA